MYTHDTFLPLSDAKIDVAAYCYSYHMCGGCNEIDHNFWADENIRQTLLRYKFDHHECGHRHSCFKKNCECRFLFPFITCSEAYIHEDSRTHDYTLFGARASAHESECSGAPSPSPTITPKSRCAASPN